jgi:ABC-type hemin transport system ATPase subunit
VRHRGRLLRVGRPADVLTAATRREVYGVEVAVHEVEVAGGRPARVCPPSLARAEAAATRSV